MPGGDLVVTSLQSLDIIGTRSRGNNLDLSFVIEVMMTFWTAKLDKDKRTLNPLKGLSEAAYLWLSKLDEFAALPLVDTEPLPHYPDVAHLEALQFQMIAVLLDTTRGSSLSKCIA